MHSKLKYAIDRLILMAQVYRDSHFCAVTAKVTGEEAHLIAAKIIEDAIADLDGEALLAFLENLRLEQEQPSIRIDT